MNRGPVRIIDGRPVQIWGAFRSLSNPRRPHYGYCTRVNVTYLDNGSSTIMTATQANKQAKPWTWTDADRLAAQRITNGTDPM